ncbi:hypothetical protein T484DRAFT_1757306 [Baffinella frigidus]|nr:hypothetical protein T484DRAFT_1757306 [Cryptophyta sp. CCMP2293]
MPDTAHSSPKRKMSMDTESDEEKTEDCGGDAKKKKPAVQKCKCPYDGCDESRRYPSELQDHVDFEHEKIYHNVCDHIDEKGAKCGKKCERRGNLEQHMRTHSDDRPHKCTVCPMAFKSDGELTQHKRTHSDARPHKCTVCLMGFKRAEVRDDHYAAICSPIDDPVRTEWKCTLCNKGFPTRSHCKAHRLHTCVPEDDPERRAHLDRINKAKRALYASDEMVSIIKKLRSHLWRMMKKHGMGKVSLSDEVMGCICEELIAHLNDNDRGFVYGRGDFHIDHIRPMASFKNLKCRVEVLKCMNFNNLQLLPGSENCSKGKSFTSTQEAAYAISKGGLAIAELEKGWRADGVCECELCKA